MQAQTNPILSAGFPLTFEVRFPLTFEGDFDVWVRSGDKLIGKGFALQRQHWRSRADCGHLDKNVKFENPRFETSGSDSEIQTLIL